VNTTNNDRKRDAQVTQNRRGPHVRPEFNAFTVTAADYISPLGQLTRWAEARGAAETIASVTFARERDDTAVTAVVVHTRSNPSGIQASTRTK
jgi:hypothetical protein